MSSLYFQICSTFYIVLLSIAFFSKRRIRSIENKIFATFIIVTIFVVATDLVSTYIAIVNVQNFMLNTICKLYLLCLLLWITIFTYYIIVITSRSKENFESREKKIGLILSSFFALTSIITMALPLYNFSKEGVVYTYGPSANLVYMYVAINIIAWILYIIKNHKILKVKKYVPAAVFVILIAFAAIIQKSHPELLIVTSIGVFVTVLMYFTIENPDVRMIEQLNVAKDSAEKANRAKTDFLSNMSHEIRTPLNAIVGFSQALKEENLPESALEEVDDIITSSNNLLEIVNGILDISKIEANKLEIVNTEYNSKKLMKEIISLIQARIGEKPLEFRTYIDESMPPVLYGDHVRIKQIIVNLLTNAVKYTKEGHIEFKVNTVIHEDVCRMIVSVEDTGIGIKSEDMNKLFTKFERFELEKNITTEGTGLGLAITKSLVDLMDGKIVVQSVYRKGSKFTVAIDQKVVPKTAEEVEEINVEESAQPFISSGSKVLVVDDNNINLKVAARLLKDYQVEVTLVLSGQECINKILNGEKYDLILMDDMMPKMTGTQTLQNLKNIIGFNIPVIALTANAITGMRERYIKAGFNDYLAKPIDRNALNIILKKYLKENGSNSNEEITESTVTKNLDILRNEGIDVDHGLELLGDEETYLMTLEEFLKESKTRLLKIEEYRIAKDMPNYAILVHAMKSDSKYLGFMKLADLSYQHELASKENNITFVEEHYDELMQEVGTILTIVKNFLEK